LFGYLKPTSNENKINQNIYQRNQALACLEGLDFLEVVNYQIRRFWFSQSNQQKLDSEQLLLDSHRTSDVSTYEKAKIVVGACPE
jgi:hypothetical protein